MSYAKFFKEKNISLDQPQKENNEVIQRNILSYFVYSNVNPGSIVHNIRVPFQGKNMVKGRNVHPRRILSNLDTSCQIKTSMFGHEFSLQGWKLFRLYNMYQE